VKLGGGDRCGATRGTDWREGEERRARCGEAEVGVHFIGPGGGGEEAARREAVEF
jgi:hypothetical protein